MKKDRIIYVTTNNINGKIYVGQDSFNRPDYLGSGKILSFAIKKYGKDNFKKEILNHCDTDKEMDEVETFWIKEKDATNHDIGYNIAKGGYGGDTLSNHPNLDAIKLKMRKKIVGSESREKISNSLKNSKKFQTTMKSEARRNKIASSLKNSEKFKAYHKKYKDLKLRCGPLNSMYGKHHTLESRKKTSESVKNSDAHKVAMQSEERRKKISLALTGQKRTEEQKAKLRGENNPMWGKEPTNKGQKMEQFECPHCHKKADEANLKRWHMDNCKLVKNRKLELCPHCKKKAIKSNIVRWHLDNCKFKILPYTKNITVNNE